MMKLSKFFVLSIVLLVMVLGFSIQAYADLNLIGTATYNSSDYNLIYDDDLNITWLDYTNALDTWDNQVGWAAGLNTADVMTYNFNPGVTMTWSDDWRLPTALNQDGSGPCYRDNCVESEMGHLYFTELGNKGYVAPDGSSPQPGFGLKNTGDFQNLQDGMDGIYWSGTEFSGDPQYMAWMFQTGFGEQDFNGKSSPYYAIAVRSGIAVVPEPMSAVLFGVGGVIMVIRRKLRRQRHG